MASTSGLGALAANAVSPDILAHLTPLTVAVPAAVVILGPINLSLSTGLHTNTVPGAECADTHYVRTPAGSITSWNAIVVTPGAGQGVGYATRTSNVALNMLNSTGTGATAAQTLTGTALYDSTATPIFVAYLNFAVSVVVPIGNTYTVALTAVSLQIS